MTAAHRTTVTRRRYQEIGFRWDCHCRNCSWTYRAADTVEANDVREKHEAGVK